MKVSSFEPSAPLQPYVEAYHVVSTDGETLHRVFPHTGLTLIFRFRGVVSFMEGSLKEEIAPYSVSGLRRSAKNVLYTKDSAALIVRLKPGAGGVFFDEPVHELFEESVPINFLAGYENLNEFVDGFSVAENDLARIVAVESFLLSRLRGGKPDDLVTTALKKITDNPFDIKIGALSNELCLSQDAFEKRFRRVVGTSPKHMATLLRMKSIIGPRSGAMSLSQLALGAGYFDQAHFNKAFKQFTGLTPGEFKKSPPPWR